MAANQQMQELISALTQSVEAGLTYFQGPGRQSTVLIGRWSAREVLCHLVWWHQATVEGMESVAAGGPPYRMYASVDEMNARAVARLAGHSVEQMVAMVPQLQERLVQAAHAIAEPSTAVFIMGDGHGRSVQQRFETITREWNTHVKELQALSAA